MEKLASISDVLLLVKDQRDREDQARAAVREQRAKEFWAKHELERQAQREAFALKLEAQREALQVKKIKVEANKEKSAADIMHARQSSAVLPAAVEKSGITTMSITDACAESTRTKKDCAQAEKELAELHEEFYSFKAMQSSELKKRDADIISLKKINSELKAEVEELKRQSSEKDLALSDLRLKAIELRGLPTTRDMEELTEVNSVLRESIITMERTIAASGYNAETIPNLQLESEKKAKEIEDLKAEISEVRSESSKKHRMLEDLGVGLRRQLTLLESGSPSASVPPSSSLSSGVPAPGNVWNKRLQLGASNVGAASAAGTDSSARSGFAMPCAGQPKEQGREKKRWLCFHFAWGTCHFGDKCRHPHDARRAKQFLLQEEKKSRGLKHDSGARASRAQVNISAGEAVKAAEEEGAAVTLNARGGTEEESPPTAPAATAAMAEPSGQAQSVGANENLGQPDMAQHQRKHLRVSRKSGAVRGGGPPRRNKAAPEGASLMVSRGSNSQQQ